MRPLALFLVVTLLAGPAAAYAGQPAERPPVKPESEQPAAAAAQPPGELPVSIQRIRRKLAQAPPSKTTGLKLEYYVDVYGKSPRLDFLAEFDPTTGAVQYRLTHASGVPESRHASGVQVTAGGSARRRDGADEVAGRQGQRQVEEKAGSPALGLAREVGRDVVDVRVQQIDRFVLLVRVDRQQIAQGEDPRQAPFVQDDEMADARLLQPAQAGIAANRARLR